MRRKANSGDVALRVVPRDSCPAKTFTLPNGDIRLGRSVPNHCQIVGEVAKEIIARLPRSLSDDLFPHGSHLVAASHDIGKVSPCFVEKLRQACTPGMSQLDRLPNVNPQLESTWGGHAGVSQLAAKALNAPKYVPEILGQHHGFGPPVRGFRAQDEVFGGPDWQLERQALVSELKARLCTDWPMVSSVPQALAIAGLTSVADWIGSGSFFEDPAIPWQNNISLALDDAGFISPTFRHGLRFEEVFDFQPRLAQQTLIEQVAGPGVYVLEAPMGLGKTEAALFAAYRMLETGRARGVYFALPTQLTSNKIFERFGSFLDRILTTDCQHRSLLLHSNAWLFDTEMGEEGRPGGAWFSQAKRGLLAPFAVGTIDQALMAAMNVKHGFVRAFGLAGKVVILDEVHTYDAYTGTLLDALVQLLRALKCTVIILSATLNHDRREQIVGGSLARDDYPLITAAINNSAIREVAVTVDSSQAVSIRLVGQDKVAIEEALERAVQGQQVLWIENTVAQAQDRYLDLAARASDLNIGCGLLHSRFTAEDRQAIENEWVSLYGKDGWGRRNQRGRILVGTQVLEQSLDIDADFMVTRFAPSDMILQRIGRLWRHAGTPRPASAICETWVLAPPLERAIISPMQEFGNTAFVYSPYVLCRSLEVWQGKQVLSLPLDIRSLIEQTYEQRSEIGPMARWLEELENGTRQRTGRNALRQLAMVTLAEAGSTLPESKAQTRYSDTDSIDVLLLRNLSILPEAMASQVTLLDGTQLILPWARHKLGKNEWRKLSATLMRQIVSVRAHDAPTQMPVESLKKFGLQHCFYLGSPEYDEAILRIGLVDRTGDLTSLPGHEMHAKHRLNYRSDIGYRVMKD